MAADILVIIPVIRNVRQEHPRLTPAGAEHRQQTAAKTKPVIRLISPAVLLQQQKLFVIRNVNILPKIFAVATEILIMRGVGILSVLPMRNVTAWENV